MNMRLKRRDGNVYFEIIDVADKYHDPLRDLVYTDFDGGFAKAFPEDTPNIDGIYRNFEQHAEEMLLQTAGERPVPWDKALLTFFDLIQHHDFNWWLCGSAALAVRGLAVQPRDIDLVVMGDGAPRLADVMRDYLVEPLVYSQDWISDWFARTFLHCRLEWIGTPYESVDAAGPTDFGPLAASRLETINWQGHLIKVPPLVMQLETCKRRGLKQRVQIIEAALVQGM